MINGYVVIYILGCLYLLGMIYIIYCRFVYAILEDLVYMIDVIYKIYNIKNR